MKIAARLARRRPLVCILFIMTMEKAWTKRRAIGAFY
ncbi:hypothetical protein BH11PLA1_BH11PLA1_13950 [soil metagenome]